MCSNGDDFYKEEGQKICPVFLFLIFECTACGTHVRFKSASCTGRNNRSLVHPHRSIDCFRSRRNNLLQDLFAVALRRSVHARLFLDVWPAPMVLFPLDSALNDGLAETVMPCDMTKPWHHPTLNSGDERFLSAQRYFFYLSPYIVLSFLLPVGKMRRTFWILFSYVAFRS